MEITAQMASSRFYVSDYTPGPWEYVPSTEHHGPYVSGPCFGDICDCYVMSNPAALSVRNGGDSYPIHHQPDNADANARLIAAAPDLFEALLAVNVLISEGAAQGFRWDIGDWAERLFHSQQATSAALKKAAGLAPAPVSP